MGFVDNTFSCFHDRYWAERWLEEMVKDERPYYTICCDKVSFNRVEELLEE